jgi:diguanylate cyclase (GGDEF)-like protein
VVARYGGEEFVIMIPEAANDAAHILSERLRKNLSEMKFDNLPSVTISLGIATFPHDGTDPEDLIRKADAAMYAAKRAGRDQVVKYSRNVKLPRDSNSKAIEN